MSDLPPTWTEAALSSITTDAIQRIPEVDEQFTYIDIGSVDRNSKNIIAPQHLLGADAPSRARKQVRSGDTLVSMTRPNLNAVALVPPELDGQIASTGFDVLRPVEGIDPRWIAYLVRTEAFIKAMSDLVQGALYPAVRSKDVRSYRVPLAPSAEQTRIADQLDKLLARIQSCNDHLDAIPGLLKRFRTAVLDAAASGDLINDEGGPANLVVRLGAVLAEPMRNGKSVRDGSGLQVLRLTALKQSGIDLAETKAGDWTGIRDVERFLVRNGDYLVSRGNGSKELVGRGGLVANCRTNIAFPDTMIRIRPDTSCLLPDYLKFVWGAPVVRKQIEAAAKTTAGIWKVSQPDLESISFPLPSLERQAVIVERVQALMNFASSIESRHVAGALQVQRLTPLTLAKAFCGELVPQDTNDEPTSALLQKLHTSVVAAPSRKSAKTPEKRLNMSNTDKDTVKVAILELKKDRFTFDELRAQFSGDYERLRVGLFELLGEPNPVVRQVFDKQTNSMQLVRVLP